MIRAEADVGDDSSGTLTAPTQRPMQLLLPKSPSLLQEHFLLEAAHTYPVHARSLYYFFLSPPWKHLCNCLFLDCAMPLPDAALL